MGGSLHLVLVFARRKVSDVESLTGRGPSFIVGQAGNFHGIKCGALSDDSLEAGVTVGLNTGGGDAHAGF